MASSKNSKKTLSGKTIALGATGSVAAIKTPALARLLSARGAKIIPLLSKSALEILSPKGVRELEQACASKCFSELFDEKTKRAATQGKLRDYTSPHLEKAAKADLLLIAPASANTINKMAAGITEDEFGAPDLLLAAFLSLHSSSRVALAPAMHSSLWNHPSTKKSVAILKERGTIFIGPKPGRLASGDLGIGRMSEPEEIAREIESLFEGDYDGKKVLVTAGPTHEYFDPVRFISNDSSGRMGIALAREACLRGGQTTIVLGPVCADVESELPKGVKIVRVKTAKELCKSALKEWKNSDFGFFAAAVSDFAPKKVAEDKIKKEGKTEFAFSLEKTPDALLECGKLKKKKQVLVGFALESENLVGDARRKLEEKNADLVIANSVESLGGIVSRVFLVSKNSVVELPLQSKKKSASAVLDKALGLRK